MKKSFPEISDTVLKLCGNFEQYDFLKFHLYRLIYESPETLVEHYNREVDIGNTGENLQIMYFIILHKLFLRQFNKSPITIDKSTNSIKVKGKVYLVKDTFEFQKENKGTLRVVR